MMDEDGYERMAAFDALYIGRARRAGRVGRGVGRSDPRIRQKFDQYVNLRPMRLLPGLTSPLGESRRRRTST